MTFTVFNNACTETIDSSSIIPDGSIVAESADTCCEIRCSEYWILGSNKPEACDCSGNAGEGSRPPIASIPIGSSSGSIDISVSKSSEYVAAHNVRRGSDNPLKFSSDLANRATALAGQYLRAVRSSDALGVDACSTSSEASPLPGVNTTYLYHPRCTIGTCTWQDVVDGWMAEERKRDTPVTADTGAANLITAANIDATSVGCAKASMPLGDDEKCSLFVCAYDGYNSISALSLAGGRQPLCPQSCCVPGLTMSCRNDATP